MKTPIQELIDKLNNVKPTEFCSIETIKGWAESLLEKEKEVMCEFVHDCADNLFSGYSGFEEYYSEKIEGIFQKTFNTKER